MSRVEFEALLQPVLQNILNRQLDGSLEEQLNRKFPVEGAYCQWILAACQQGDIEGWLCEREGGGIRYGRAIKPTETTGGFSVDVVQMRDIAGPHHVHPNGEIDLILPIEGAPTFDGHEKTPRSE
jgi:Domain of unknown function (DUF4863)